MRDNRPVFLPVPIAAVPVIYRCVAFMRFSRRLSDEDWALVKDVLVGWARGGYSSPKSPQLESVGGPIPDRLLRRLGRRRPFVDVPECELCGRRVIVPAEESGR